jgi:hypothetical protein
VFRVLILWSWNEWTEFYTATPWPVLRTKYGIDGVQEVHGYHKPWASRFVTPNGDIIVIDMPEGTLD